MNPRLLKAVVETVRDLYLEQNTVIQKSFNPIAKEFRIEKAWKQDNTTFVEGWVSTEDEDLQKDTVPPESFLGAIDDYFSRSAPLSMNHDLTKLPVGHAQKAVLVRDGNILHTALHPRDPAEFENFEAKGTGLYARFAVTDPDAADAVLSNNIGAFSWIGNVTHYTRKANGGKHFLKVSPFIESTLAAYPVNQKAVITAAKAYGLVPEE
ncbi:hypothetical protein [Ktedonospora formicarum]|uniref:Uncharacterized protein n=1 Tax=Ktedonospora formicarum TaxID=2778364 RepID=A0A8J3HUY6_9CHLR|nr:hypothetical protein [Ktedonospora formicarum]GHO44522.1 hypothetical protein KSX_26850 [Ktedonospora formicarum]